MRAARGVGRRYQRAEGGGHVAVERRTHCGERERAMAPYEQRHAERLLERLHLARKSRLVEKKLLRLARERKVPGGRLEALELVVRHQASQRFMHASTS